MEGGMSVLLVVGRRPLVGALDIEIWSRAHERHVWHGCTTCAAFLPILTAVTSAASEISCTDTRAGSADAESCQLRTEGWASWSAVTHALVGAALIARASMSNAHRITNTVDTTTAVARHFHGRRRQDLITSSGQRATVADGRAYGGKKNQVPISHRDSAHMTIGLAVAGISTFKTGGRSTALRRRLG